MYGMFYSFAFRDSGLDVTENEVDGCSGWNVIHLNDLQKVAGYW